jgi:hypothetical protein
MDRMKGRREERGGGVRTDCVYSGIWRVFFNYFGGNVEELRVIVLKSVNLL